MEMLEIVLLAEENLVALAWNQEAYLCGANLRKTSQIDLPSAKMDPPPALKPISAYLKLAKEYDKRDPVVAYFCEYLTTLDINT